MPAPPALWIGTSGWVYKHWLGSFYPPGLPADAQLPFFARHFPTVEVNFSFYRLPERSVFETWRQQTPPGYLFAVKASRYLTHMKKLKEPEEPLQRLMERATGLEEKLGPILFQFPHTWHANVPRLADFTAALRPYVTGQAATPHPGPHRFAFEFRHQSWLTPEVYALLERDGHALCLPSHPHMPLQPHLTAEWTFIRFHTGRHGIGYSDEELRDWAQRIEDFRHRGAAVYAYFNNDIGGHALRDGRRLAAFLGQPLTQDERDADEARAA